MGEISDQGLILYGQESLYSVFEQSLIARRFESLDFEAETVVKFSPEYFQQMAGLVCYYNSKNWTTIHIGYDEEKGKISKHFMLRSRCFKLAVKRSRNDTIKRRTGLFKGECNKGILSIFLFRRWKIWTKIPAKFDTYKLSDDYIAKPFLGPTGSAFTGAL